MAYDPCYHAACDTYDNVNTAVLDINADAIAYAVVTYAMTPAGELPGAATLAVARVGTTSVPVSEAEAAAA